MHDPINIVITITRRNETSYDKELKKYMSVLAKHETIKKRIAKHNIAYDKLVEKMVKLEHIMDEMMMND